MPPFVVELLNVTLEPEHADVLEDEIFIVGMIIELVLIFIILLVTICVLKQVELLVRMHFT